MEEQPRAQPITLMKAGAQSRTSKLVQKLSNFRSRIRLSSTRKGSVNLALEGPYMRQSTSIDAGMAKPYMSQPMLAPNPYNIQQRRDVDESLSSSPSSSPTGSEPCGAPVPPKRTRHSISTAVVTGTNTGVVFTGKSITFDGLPGEAPVLTTSATLKHGSGLPTDHRGTAESSTILMEAPHVLISKQVASLSRPPFQETPIHPSSSSASTQQRTNNTPYPANDSEPKHRPANVDNSRPSLLPIPNATSSTSSSPPLSRDLAPDYEETLSFASTSTKSFHTPPSHSHSLHGGSSSFLPMSSTSLLQQTTPRSQPTSRGANSFVDPSRLTHDTSNAPELSDPPAGAVVHSETASSALSGLKTTMLRPGQPVSLSDTDEDVLSGMSKKTSSPNSDSSRPSSTSITASSHSTRSVFSGSTNVRARGSVPFIFPPRTPGKEHDPAPDSEKMLPMTPVEAISDSGPRVSSSAYGTTPTRRTPPALPMPLRRFSMTLAEGTGSARLSPSLITRHPPMPILNLPTLPPSTPSSSSDALSSDANRPHQKLRSMPALPRQGTNIDEDDEDEDEDDGEDTEDGEDFVEASDGGDDGDDRTAEDSPRAEDRPALASPSRQYKRTQALPPSLNLPINLARLDLSFLDDPPRSSDMKGKGKQREDSDLASATPTASRTKGFPTPQQQQFSDDYFSIATPSSPMTRTPSTTTFSPTRTPRLEDGMQIPGSPLARGHQVDGRPTIYKHASRSMINIVGPSLCRRDEEKETNRENEIEVVSRTAGLAGVVARLPSSIDKVSEPSSLIPHPPLRKASAGGTPGTLHRRRSLPTFTAGSPPPPYPSFAPYKGLHLSSHQLPPDFDAPHIIEGRETLPEYSNSIYLRTVMPRKMEFTQPGVQAKDRKWRRVVCELEGTVFRVYECPREAAGVSAIGSWWERKVGVGDVSIPAASGSASTKKASDAVLGDRTELASKLGEVAADVVREGSQTDVQLSSQSPVPSQQEPQQTFIHSNQSRSKLVNLLKPSRPHSRSRSDIPNPPRLTPPSQPRSSLSTPRPRTPTVAMSSPSDNRISLVVVHLLLR
ncbi:uncharacterized protein EV420DRAFT_411066 [Desarmillaria tabescens]|uniref:PH domain-containing protein n=1 Tax=Armillaria tabescens TaxID=1929756 RepID=A0AA39N4Q3_ARMTA|nr:uncharacterized protein EV420DRAFT_411066 [Desarmillaria tabescens]KAK0458056.1 hypothetical protein EV420DRAFT_411066 [Desarmillaria tabescens]